MTKQEVKDEHKQTDGSPEVKAKIRRMQMENQENPANKEKHLKMFRMQQQLSRILPFCGGLKI